MPENESNRWHAGYLFALAYRPEHTLSASDRKVLEEASRRLRAESARASRLEHRFYAVVFETDECADTVATYRTKGAAEEDIRRREKALTSPMVYMGWRVRPRTFVPHSKEGD